MLVLNTAIAALIITASAAPLLHHNQARQNVTTASERLGLQWLGGNSSLPKIL
jgi:L-asparaginase